VKRLLIFDAGHTLCRLYSDGTALLLAPMMACISIFLVYIADHCAKVCALRVRGALAKDGSVAILVTATIQ